MNGDTNAFSFNILLYVVVSLAVGFVFGFYLNWTRVKSLQNRLEVFEIREKVLHTLTAPDGSSPKIPPKVINSLTAPTR